MTEHMPIQDPDDYGEEEYREFQSKLFSHYTSTEADEQREHYPFVNGVTRSQTSDHSETVLQFGLLNAGDDPPLFRLTNG